MCFFRELWTYFPVFKLLLMLCDGVVLRAAQLPLLQSVKGPDCVWKREWYFSFGSRKKARGIYSEMWLLTTPPPSHAFPQISSPFPSKSDSRLDDSESNLRKRWVPVHSCMFQPKQPRLLSALSWGRRLHPGRLVNSCCLLRSLRCRQMLGLHGQLAETGGPCH